MESGWVSTDHYDVAVGILGQRVDSAGAASGWGDGMGRADGGGAGLFLFEFYGFYWYLVPVLVGADGEHDRGIIALDRREGFSFRS